MEFFRIALCLCTMVPCILSGGPALRYENYNEDPIIVMPGAKSLTLVWETDLGSYEYYNIYEFKHLHPVTMAERLIGKVNVMTPSEVATGYSFNVTQSDYLRILALTIDTVARQDDGTFKATVSSTQDSQTDVDVLKNVTVIKKLDEVHLQFHEREPISSKPEDAVEVEAGSHPVKCIAEGSNPATSDVKLHLDGNVVTLTGDPKVEMMEGDIRQFKTTVMGNVELSERTAAFEVECVATDQSGETLSTKLDLKVMVPEKGEVKCQETKAKEGDMSVSLVCTVDNTNTNVTSMAFQIGKTGEVIQVGQGNANSSYTVTATNPSGKSSITLTLAKAEDWHFSTDFYLVITTSDGNVRKEPLTLKKAGDGDYGNCLTASFGWILFLAISVLLSLN